MASLARQRATASGSTKLERKGECDASRQQQADCQAAAPGIGRVNACHALKLIALTFAVVSTAFSAGLITAVPTPLSSAVSYGESDANAAEAIWKPMQGRQLRVVEPVVRHVASDPELDADEMPDMDVTPRSKAIRDYGLPKDHPYTPPEARQKTALTRPLRTAEFYASRGGTLRIAARANASDADLVDIGSSGPRDGWPKGVFRTHDADPDPIVVTFDGFLAQEAAKRVIDAALPQMRRAAVTSDKGGSRTSQGRSNDLTWLPHDHVAVRP